MRESERWHHEETDVEENANSAPPEDERIEWVGIWLAELYAPSHATRFIEGLKKLDSRSSGISFHHENLGERVRSARTWTSGFTNVGFFAQPGTFLGSSGTAGLPSEFSFAALQIRHLAPGISVLVAQFAISEDHRLCLDEIARKDVATRAEPIKGGSGHSIIGPGHAKQEMIGEKRVELRGLAARWLNSYFPGLFLSSGIENIPTWDFITTDSCSLIAPKADRTRWRDTFGYGWGERSESAGLPGVELVIARGYERSHVCHTFATTRSNADEILEKEEFCGSGINSFLQLIDKPVSDLLPLWALELALRHYENRFSEIRDDMSTPPNWYRRRGHLRKLQKTVLPLAFDLESLRDASENSEALAMRMRHTRIEFQSPRLPLDPKPEASERSLMSHLRDRIAEQGKAVSSQVHSITSGLRVQTDLLLASSNVRLQWIVILLTLLLGALGLYASDLAT